MTERRVNEPVGPNYPYGTGQRYRLLDRVRWSAVFAGVFTALATMLILGLLGLAIGLTAYDVGERARTFTVGAGIWAIGSMLVAFFLGGWVAARTAVATGDSGSLNGAMVWCTAIPLAFLVGAVSVFGTAASMAPIAGDRVIRAATNMPGAEQTSTTDTGTTAAPVDAQKVREGGAKAAWWTLAALLLALGASALGGYAGQRSDRAEYTTRSTSSTTNLPPSGV